MEELRSAVRAVCDRFPDAYWRDLDAKREYPEAFVAAMTEAGFLGALIPAEYGGMGLDIAHTSVILEEINAPAATRSPRTRRSTRWARCCGTAARPRSASTCRGSPAASCACRPSA